MDDTGYTQDTLDAGHRAMSAELVLWLPALLARERSGNVAQALSGGDIEPERAVADMLAGHLDEWPGWARATIISRVAEAWRRAVARCEAA